VIWDAGYDDLLGLIRHPGRLSLGEAPHLRPIGLIRSRRLVPGWTVIHGYNGLIRRLRQLPGAVVDEGNPRERNPNANVVLFGYDFRKSVAEAAEALSAEVNARLAGLTNSARVDRVIVIGHSMGGLVARYWIGVLGGWQVCRALVTLGTPHRGAPKALNIVVNGVSLGWKQFGGVTELLRGWPSIAQLLPRYPMIWDIGAGTDRYPRDLPIDGLRNLTREADRVHVDMDAAWRQVPRQRPEMAVRLGWSHPTVGTATWDGTRLTMTKDQPSWLSVSGWADDHGDGTVPALAAVPPEMDGHNPAEMRVRQRHGPLGGARFITKMIEDYERWTPLTPVRGSTAPAAISLDLDEVYPAGEPVTVNVTVRPHPEGLPGAVVWASLRPADSPISIADERLEWDPVCGTFTGRLLAPSPGLYDVFVTARGIPGTEDLDASDSVAVLAE
jgi:pimeloyl-ACP methyl ester carboxylesterase